MGPLVAHCYLGLGTLHAKAGASDLAREELSTAIEAFRAMGMDFWLDRATVALADAI